MAGDWIKMRIDLQTHPKVVRILSALRPHDIQTRTDKFRVIGGLHAIWSVFDTHSEDGVLHGYTLETLDHVIGWDGFSSAVRDVGWLDDSEEGSIIMPGFQEHNGKSAKRRAEDQKRKRDSRSCPQPVRNTSANQPDKNRTREEKRREDSKQEGVSDCDVSFDEFWNAYPRKVAKAHAFKAWQKLKPDDGLLSTILEAVKVQSKSDAWSREGGKFVPYAATWLNGRRWEDQIEPEKPRSSFFDDPAFAGIIIGDGK